jgi:hypothetical protein
LKFESSREENDGKKECRSAEDADNDDWDDDDGMGAEEDATCPCSSGLMNRSLLLLLCAC